MQLLSLAGTVGKDAVLRTTERGDDVLGFSLAVNNGKDKDPTWFDCAVWGERARKLEPHIKKGSKLSLYGRPTARAHDGKAYLGVNVDQLTFQSSSQRHDDGFRGQDDGGVSGLGGGGGHSEQGGRGSGAKGHYDLNDDIPFVRLAIEGEA